MGPYLETTESAAPPLLVLSPASNLRITLCGVNSPYDGLTAFSRKRPLEPVAGNSLDGFCEGDGHKRVRLKIRPYPTMAFRTNGCTLDAVVLLVPIRGGGCEES
jgi:hypothetical protein